MSPYSLGPSLFPRVLFSLMPRGDVRGELRARFQTEFRIDRRQVLLDRLLGDRERRRSCPVRLARGDLQCEFALARGEEPERRSAFVFHHRVELQSPGVSSRSVTHVDGQRRSHGESKARATWRKTKGHLTLTLTA